MNDPTNCSEKCPLGTYYDTTVTFHARLSIHFAHLLDDAVAAKKLASSRCV